MNTALLKTFGQKARTLLIDGVTRKLLYWGFDKTGNVLEQPEPLPGGYKFRENIFDDPIVPMLWKKLSASIASEGIKEIAERAAYIWFNRLMALQILGKNRFEEPMLVPVSAEEQTPVIVKNARMGQYDFLNKSEQVRLQKILTDYEKETQLFGILLIGFCHSHILLNKVFGGIEDYTELLLPDDILSPGGFLDLLNNGDYITDDEYKQVELIGWLYQFYISEKKDQVFKAFKAGKKAEAKDIPAATQIFTPNWIVKYMVENTVGKIWLDKHPTSSIKEQMLYLVEVSKGDEIAEPIIEEVKQLKLLDPAVGSGHILVEGFDLLFKMYLEEYYPVDEAVGNILQNNLFGLDIDLRAAQLAQFAVLIKAAQYYPEIIRKGILPHIYAMPSAVHFTNEDIYTFLGDTGKEYVKQLQDVLHLMLHAQNLGSIMQFEVSSEAKDFIKGQFLKWKNNENLDLLEQELLLNITPYLNVLLVLTQQYEAIAANPPYMGAKNMNIPLKNYVLDKYPLGKNDLMTVFIEYFNRVTTKGGKYSFITPPSWIFLSSFENLRLNILKQNTIDSLLHLSRGVFGADFGSVSIVIEKIKPSEKSFGIYFKLIDRTFQEFHQRHLQELFLKSSIDNHFKFDFNNYNKDDLTIEFSPIGIETVYLYNQYNFFGVPSYPIAYWLTERALKIFKEFKQLKEVCLPKQGLSTTNNDLFLRRWHEVNSDFINRNAKNRQDTFCQKKWYPYHKGGGLRKWYGNNDTVINWQNDGEEIHKYIGQSHAALGAPLRGKEFLFRSGMSWSAISSSNFAGRYVSEGGAFDAKGPLLVEKVPDSLLYCMALLNSNVANYFFKALAPTMDFNQGPIGKMPIKIVSQTEINKIVLKNIEIARNDWDSREASMDFRGNILITLGKSTLEQSYQNWLAKSTQVFLKLHKQEEELSKAFVNIYGLHSEVSTKIYLEQIFLFYDEIDFDKLKLIKEPHDDFVLPIKKEVLIEQFLSYAIGCFMGRYRLDLPFLQITHPNPITTHVAAYNYTSSATGICNRFEIDDDGIIPLMSSRSNFADDTSNRIKDFLRIIWGEEKITENINFMQDCLNRDLEEYLVKKFWGDHVQAYSKKPIYWLFSSKKGAFQVLVYMHRMNRFTTEKIRDKYLLKHIQFLDQEIARMESNMSSLTKADQKKLDQLRKDLQECNDYDLLLKDVATRQIEFDLDDGVTHNYELFKGVVALIK